MRVRNKDLHNSPVTCKLRMSRSVSAGVCSYTDETVGVASKVLRTSPVNFKLLVSRRDSEGFRWRLFAALMKEHCEGPAQGFAY